MVILRFRTGNGHLSECKNQGSRPGITDPHDDGGETLVKRTNARVVNVRTLQSTHRTNLGVVFRIPGMQRHDLPAITSSYGLRST
jgi:hypothetical protein